MNKKVLLFGATGMAGHMIYFYLKETGRYDITNVVFREKLTADSIIMDVSDKDAVANLITTQKPDIIINCIGILIKGSKEHPDNAILINAWLPHWLKKFSDEIGARLIHISTDCVFSGEKGGYAETDFRDADDIYGRSKALGEIINDKDVTLRTSIIGPELKKSGEGLFHWFMQQEGEVNGFSKAYWGGVTTFELARAVEKAILNNVTGLVHVTNGERISKYDLVSLFKDVWNKTAVKINKYESKSADKSLLASTRFNFNVPGYRQMLLDQKAWMESHADLYNKIYPGTYISI